MKKWIVVFLAVMLTGLVFWSCSDDNNSTDPVTDPYITVTAPNGGETWQMGTTQSITWSDNIIEKVRIQIFKGGLFNIIISDSTESDGIYNWVIPITITAGADYKVRITSTKTSTLFDESNANFSMTSASTADMVFVHSGTFKMGDHFDPEGESDEVPTHSVTLRDFYIGATEVTQSEWATYMPAESWSSPYGVGDTYPAYYVSWYEIIRYCNLRSIAEGLTPCYTISSSTDPADWGAVPTDYNTAWDAAICNWNANGYRLPSEAEWEYASRGGMHNADNLRYSGCNLETDLTNYAWYSGNSSYTSHPVSTKLPNQLGLYDMSGNLYELCWDWFSSYTSDVQTDPYGSATGSYRIKRGGYCYYYPFYCRVANRDGEYPYHRGSHIGFRLSRTP